MEALHANCALAPDARVHFMRYIFLEFCFFFFRLYCLRCQTFYTVCYCRSMCRVNRHYSSIVHTTESNIEFDTSDCYCHPAPEHSLFNFSQFFVFVLFRHSIFDILLKWFASFICLARVVLLRWLHVAGNSCTNVFSPENFYHHSIGSICMHELR